jgi:hypothetical protein
MVTIPDDQELHDMKLNDNREVFVGSSNDIALTEGIETVEQSVGIHAGRAVRPLIGEPVDSETLSDIESELKQILQRDDVQIEDVRRVEIDSIDRTNGVVTVLVFAGYNNEFSLEVVA